MRTAHALIQGEQAGTIPARVSFPLPHIDPRTAALRVLRKFTSELTFFRPGDVGKEPISFQIPESQFHIEQPDNIEGLDMPAISVVQDDIEEYAPMGLAPVNDERTIDEFGKGTVLRVLYEQIEMITLEIWAPNKPVRRSLIAGLQVALSMSEERAGTIFRVPEYWNRLVRFTPDANNRPDNDQVVRGRRVARMKIDMRIDVVQLINSTTLQPYMTIT